MTISDDELARLEQGCMDEEYVSGVASDVALRLLSEIRKVRISSALYKRQRDALRDQIDGEGCAAAHAGETTYECDIQRRCGLCRLRGERDALRKQLPDGMKHCTIVFKECRKGHGWLTATNWVAFPCPTCERDTLRVENEALKKDVAATHQAETSNRTRIRLLEAEAAELRASLADAVGKIALIEPVCTEALARRRAFHARHQDKDGAWEEYDRAREAFGIALDRYEASLPGLVKVES